MQISDKLGQYNRNLNNGTEELRSSQGMQKLVSTLSDLSAGSVFEGTVNTAKGGKVALALGNGQMIVARLEGKVDVKPGTAMFFQVKSNDGSTVSIRPYSGVGNASNPILMNALTAAQVPVTDRTLSMVDAMMQEHMSVDRQSILDMVKVLNANPNVNVQTMVQMTKLGMPVTEAMASQFEQYLSDQHALLSEMELAVNQVAETLGDESLTPEQSFALYSKVVDILTEGNISQTSILQNNVGQIGATQAGVTQADALFTQLGHVAEDVQQGMVTQPQADAVASNMEGTQAARLFALMNGETQGTVNLSQNTSGIIQGETLGTLFSETQMEILGKTLQDMPMLVGNTTLFVTENVEELFIDTMQDDTVLVSDMSTSVEGETGGIAATEENLVSTKLVLNKELSVGEFLRALRGALAGQGELGYLGAQKLFAGKEFQAILRSAAEEQWLIRPQDLKEEQRISKLYEKMERQIGQLEAAMKSVGVEQNSFLQTAADIRGNIQFMNQMNQIYNYVQMPLKLSGQNANGELYVYTNKKNLNDPEAELTAFLHLDMETLGSTDVSVRMKDRKVKTNFYFDNDTSYKLVEMHLPILEKRLKNKGYDCTLTITNEKRGINFKDNFVRKGNVSAGSVHRYSFDVRA